MKKLTKIILTLLGIFGFAGLAFALPYFTTTQTQIPFVGNTYDLGTSTGTAVNGITSGAYRNIYGTNLYLFGLSDGCLYTVSGLVTSNVGNPTCTGGGGGGSGSGTVATSTALVAGQVDFSTSASTIGNDATFLFSTAFKRLTATNSTTTYASFTNASTTNLIVNGESFNDLTGIGLSISGNALTNNGVISLTNGTGTTCSGTNPGTCNVNTSQNIATLSNLTTNGFITTAGGVGTLGVQTFPISVAQGGTGAVTLTGCLTGNGTGAITGSGTCNTSAASVTSVGLSSTNSTLTIGSTPVTTSGTITADINLAHTNTWTILQNFNYSSTTGSASFQDASTTIAKIGTLILPNIQTCNTTSALTTTAGVVSCGSISGGGGSGTVSAGLKGQLGYYNSSGTTLQGTSTNPLYVDAIFATSTNATSTFLGVVGIGTTYPKQVNTNSLLTVASLGSADVIASTTDNTSLSDAIFRVYAPGASMFIGSHGTNQVTTQYGITVGGWSEIGAIDSSFNTSNGLLIGTRTTNKPIVFGNNSLERMRIDTGGNVGIGTTTPYGNFSIHASSQTNPYFTIGSSTATVFSVSPIIGGDSARLTLSTSTAGCLNINNVGLIWAATCAGGGSVTSVIAGAGFQNQGLNITSSGTLVGAIATATTPVIGNVAMWTQVGDATTPARLGIVATSTVSFTSPLSGTSFNVLGSGGGAITLNTVPVSKGGTNQTSYPINSIITSDALGTSLIATGTQLTVGNILATTTAVNQFNGVIVAPDGTLANPAFSFSDDQNNGIYSPANDIFAILTNGIERFRINDSSGYSSLGTTTEGLSILTLGTSTAPQLTLSDNTGGDSQWTFRNSGGNLFLATTTVAGTATSSQAVLSINTNGVTSFSNQVTAIGGVSTPAFTANGDTDTGVGFAGANTITFSTNAIEAGRINSLGQWSIGTTTSWMNSILTLVGTTTVQGQIGSLLASTTASATQNINWSSGNKQTIMLTANTNIVINATSSNPVNGFNYVLEVCQDLTGSRTLTWANPTFLDWETDNAGNSLGTTTISSGASLCTQWIMWYRDINGNKLYHFMASSTGRRLK